MFLADMYGGNKILLIFSIFVIEINLPGVRDIGLAEKLTLIT